MERIEQEIALLQSVVPEIVVSADRKWVMIRSYRLPAGWSHATTDIAIHFRPGYEQCGLYGIYARPGLTYQGTQPNNYAEASGVPFEGDWWVFSWELEPWQANADVRNGSNIINWYHGIASRFREGL